MTGERRGGRWALGGYLYQLIGQFSLAVTPLGGWLIEDNEIEGRFLIDARDGDAETRAENLGQDAAYIADNGITLVQFKYSSTGRGIGSSEIEEMVEGLVSAATNAKGYQVIRCALVTNRVLNGPAKETWDAEVREQARQLEFVLQHLELEDAKQALDEFGKTYGALPAERTRGIEQLLGRALGQIGESTVGLTIRAGDFIEAMTGHDSARCLTVDEICQVAEQDLSRFGDNYFSVDRWKGRGVRREMYDDLVRATQEHALVVVSGPGGCGKSMLIWRLLADITDKREGACAVELARSPTAISIPGVVNNKWREIPPGHEPNDTPEKAIQRVIVANEDRVKPILYLGLDGIDEEEHSGSVRRETEQMIRFFYSREEGAREEPPPATLIVSCRQKDEIAKEWLSFVPGREEIGMGHVGIDEFSDTELYEAMKDGAPSAYSQLQELSRSPVLADSDPLELEKPLYRGDPMRGASARTLLNRDVLNMLRHPTMWQALMRLEEQTREQALRGEPPAVIELISNFLEWYHYKLCLRNRELQHLDVGDLREVIGTIAVASGGGTNHDRDTGWVDPACETNLVTQIEARELYQEARSVGMILESERTRWGWRNETLADLLSRIGRTDE